MLLFATLRFMADRKLCGGSHAKFEKPFESFGTWTDKIAADATSASGHQAGTYVSFPSGVEPVVMKIGISFVA
jgi:putative alpha-1,2-mannosidase